MPPSHELRGELLRDGVLLDEPRQEPLAEEPHQGLCVACREGVEASVVRERAVGRENVQMNVPLQQVAAAGDRDHDPGPCVGSQLSPHVLAECLRTALREIEQQLPPFPEYASQQPGHGEATWRCATGSSTSSRSDSAQRMERFFSQEGQNDRPRHEYGIK